MQKISIVPQTIQNPDIFITFLSRNQPKGPKNKKIFKKIGFKGRKNDFCHLNEQLYFGITGVISKDDWRLLGYKVGQEVQKFEGTKKIAFTEDLPVSSQEFFEGLFLAYYNFDRYKSKKSNINQSFLIDNFQEMEPVMYRAKSIISAQCLVRDIVNTPTCDMYQEDVFKQVQKAFKGTNVKVEKYNEKKLKKLGMRGLLAVNRSSNHEAMVIKLSYEPNKYKEHDILVGKGVVYDTGGLSLKPNDSMVTMKYDKAGAITVMGIMKAISETGSDKKITAYMGMVENTIGPDAYMPGDILKMLNGLTVHVKNTDAEGRLVLADVLTLAERENPNLTAIYSIATLTGAAVKAFGPETAALSGFNDKMKKRVIKAGKETDELFANAMFNKYMMKAMDDDIADLSNLSSRDTLGSQTAGLFLTKFLSKKVSKKYLHIDMAGPGYAHSPWGLYKKGSTGFGVRSMVELLSKK